MTRRRVEHLHPTRWVALALLVAVLPLAACRGTSEEDAAASSNEPATVEPIEGTDLSRVTLTAQAAERLGVETASVQERTAGGAELTVVPYSALVYGADGTTWVYTSPEQLAFVRAQVTVARIDGEEVLLSESPPPGTRIVTVAAAELYGAELGVE